MIHLPSKEFVRAKSPTILTVAGIVGLGITVIFAVKNTGKAVRLLDEAWKDVPDDIKEERQDFTLTEKAKIAWKCYIPTVISGGATVTTMIVGNHIAMEQVKTMAGLYSAAQASAALYERKVEELVGHKKAEEIKGETIKEEMRQKPPIKARCHHVTDSDNLMYDRFNEVYFYMDQVEYERRINTFNEQLLHNNCNWLSDDDYLAIIGIPSRQYARALYFDVANGLLEPTYRPEFLDDGVTVVTTIEYNWPRSEYECPSMSRYNR